MTEQTVRKQKKLLPSTLRFVLRVVEDNPSITAPDIMKITSYSSAPVQMALNELVEQGLVFTPDVSGNRGNPRRYTAAQPSELATVRSRLAEVSGELQALRAFKAEAIARYPDLAGKSIEQLVREEIARLFPEYGPSAAAGELDNTLLAASIRTRLEAERGA